MIPRKKCCCFTGHRPEKLPWHENEDDPRCRVFKETMVKELELAYKLGYRHFISSMARGTDLYFCEAVLLLQKNTDITVEAAVPFPNQSTGWKTANQIRYASLLEQCNYETVVSHRYTSGCLQRRNRYMVDHSSLLFAAYDEKKGGTLYTLTYTIEQNLTLVILDL